MLLIVALRRLLCRSSGRLVHIVPAPVVIRLPTRPGVLIDVAIVSGIHVPVRGFPGGGVAVGRAGRCALTTRRGLDSSRRTIRVAGMLGICRVAILADHGLSPRPVCVRALM